MGDPIKFAKLHFLSGLYLKFPIIRAPEKEGANYKPFFQSFACHRFLCAKKALPVSQI